MVNSLTSSSATVKSARRWPAISHWSGDASSVYTKSMGSSADTRFAAATSDVDEAQRRVCETRKVA